MIFNEHMSWDAEVQCIAGRLSKVVGIIYKSRHILPFSVLILLYNSLFYSCYNYCFLVWGSTTATNMHHLLVLQKRIIRIMCNAEFNAHTLKLFENLHIVSITEHYNYKLLLTYQTSVRQNQLVFLSIANMKRRVPAFAVRCVDTWSTPRPRTGYGLQMLQYSLPKVINNTHRFGRDVMSLSREDIRSLFL